MLTNAIPRNLPETLSNSIFTPDTSPCAAKASEISLLRNLKGQVLTNISIYFYWVFYVETPLPGVLKGGGKRAFRRPEANFSASESGKSAADPA